MKEKTFGEQSNRIQFGGNDLISIMFDDARIDVNKPELVKIGLDEIQCEINFWNSELYCYMVGANPPYHVMEGFIRRIWHAHGVDKVVLVKPVIFVVSFQTTEKHDLVLNGANPFLIINLLL